jgi:hypothetical protein
MKEEFNSLTEMKTWELVKLPPGRQAIGCKWVFRVKHNSDGFIARFKSRLVAQGFSQQERVDYNETYAPVTKFTTIRTIIALAAMKNYQLHHLDINPAYLNAEVKEDIYMKQPKGFEQGEDLVCKLKKSIYGLKQSGRNWNQLLTEWMLENDFERSQVDPACLSRRATCSLSLPSMWMTTLMIRISQ